MYICETCNFYRYQGKDEFVGNIGTCHYNPPVFVKGEWNRFPMVKLSSWCGKWQSK